MQLERAAVWDRTPRSAERALARFELEAGGRWRAVWDASTGVPTRLWGAGLPAPKSVASPERAEAFARAFLARHIELLAPGSRAEDFVLASNTLHDGLRSVAFFQQFRGLRVLTGQLGFAFKNDRLIVLTDGEWHYPDVELRGWGAQAAPAQAVSPAPR